MEASEIRWLMNFFIGATACLPDLNIMPFEYVIRSNKEEYSIVKKPAGTTEQFSLYHCILPSQRTDHLNELGVLKIAADIEQNNALDREAMILDMMLKRSLEIDSNGKKYYHHHFFSRLHETFVCGTQQNRRVSILGFAKDICGGMTQQTPLSTIVNINRRRVDPRTSVWIVGKALKTMIFTNEMGIANRNINLGNFLIEKNLHNVLLFDWRQAEIYPDGRVPYEVAVKDIKDLGLMAFQLLNGDPKKGVIPEDPQMVDDRYPRMLMRLVNGDFRTARRAYDEFYKLCDSLWVHEYYDYTDYPINEEES